MNTNEVRKKWEFLKRSTIIDGDIEEHGYSTYKAIDELCKHIEELQLLSEKIQSDLDCYLDGIQEQLDTDRDIATDVCDIVVRNFREIK